MNIRYQKWGTACRIDGIVYMNEKLLDPYWKDLHNRLLDHESKHTDKFASIKDFKIDLMPNFKLLWFMLRTPRAWIDFLPISYFNKHITLDFNMIIMYIILGGMIYAFFRIV